MCSLGGFIFKNFNNVEDKKELIINLLLSMVERGTDATGISLINTIENKISVYKLPLPAYEFVIEKGFIKFLDKLNNSNIVLLHTRQATTGDKKDNKNNHPIFKKDTNSVIIHNGMISNHKELKKEFKLKCDGEVDSEVLIDLYHTFGKDLNKLYEKVNGSYSFSLYHNKKLILFRYSNPLHIAYLKEIDSICFCSTSEIMKNAFSEYRFYENNLFCEKKNKFTIINRELENHSYIEFNFNDLKYTWNKEKVRILWDNEVVIKKKKKKNKNIPIQIVNKSDKLFSYLDKQYSKANNLEELWEDEEEWENYGYGNYNKKSGYGNYNKKSYSDNNGLICDKCKLPISECICSDYCSYFG